MKIASLGYCEKRSWAGKLLHLCYLSGKNEKQTHHGPSINLVKSKFLYFNNNHVSNVWLIIKQDKILLRLVAVS